jgi:hypothetical protein
MIKMSYWIFWFAPELGIGFFLGAATRLLLCFGQVIHFLTVLLHKKLYLIFASAVSLPAWCLSSITPAVLLPLQMHFPLYEDSGRNDQQCPWTLCLYQSQPIPLDG